MYEFGSASLGALNNNTAAVMGELPPIFHPPGVLGPSPTSNYPWPDPYFGQGPPPLTPGEQSNASKWLEVLNNAIRTLPNIIGSTTGAPLATGAAQPTEQQIRDYVRSKGYDPDKYTADANGKIIAIGGGAAEDLLTKLGDYVQAHPYVVGGGLLAVYLLFREPPRRR